MNKRFNNKKLIFILAGLVVVLILTFIRKIPAENASLKSRIVEFDTAEVSKIVLYPKGSINSPVEFSRGNSKWTVQQGTIVSATKKDAVKEIFNELVNLKPQMLAAKSKAKWEEFELTDSLATRLKFINNKGKVLADIMIGKVNYKQVNNPYGGNSVQGTSFIRLTDEKEIYGVEGFLSFFFNGGFNEWRDKTFIRSNKNDISKIAFSYPSDSSFTLTKSGTKWYASNQLCDSVKVSNFLNALTQLDGQEIKDGFKPVVSPEFQMIVEGDNLVNFSVKCFGDAASDEYILNSSLNPDVYFSSKRNGIFERVFKSRKSF
jgi:hypothetical protein